MLSQFHLLKEFKYKHLNEIGALETHWLYILHHIWNTDGPGQVAAQLVEALSRKPKWVQLWFLSQVACRSQPITVSLSHWSLTISLSSSLSKANKHIMGWGLKKFKKYRWVLGILSTEQNPFPASFIFISQNAPK